MAFRIPERIRALIESQVGSRQEKVRLKPETAPEARLKPDTTFGRRHPRVLAGAALVIALVFWSGVAASAWFVRGILTGLPENDTLRGIGTMAQSTSLLDVHDTPAFTIFSEQRIDVPLAGVSPNLIDAIIAIEDQRFYDHGGVDVIRIMGAAVNNLRARRAAQGGSTITQQLARQSFLTPDKTLRRKLMEVVVAARLEKAFTKDEILELYLNKVYFGDGLYGVEAASLGYFGKHAAELSVSEAALLAGLVKSPSTYAPTVNLDRAIARRDVVLRQMRASGVIDEATYDDARAAKITLSDALGREEGYGQYFKEEVRKQLVEQFGWDRVYQGGLRVYTTIDLDMQKAAEAEVLKTLESIEKQQAARRGRKKGAAEGPPLQAALVALDPHTGEVRAMVGGRDFDASHFNRATQARRQPGSAFKPFVYAAALESGYSPASLITGLNDPIATLQGDWVPEDEHLTTESITMRTALRTSSNRAAVRMLQEVGIPATVKFAGRLGVGSVPSVPSLALGSGEVTLMSMTAAYSAFANDGMLPTPTLIRRVETSDGEVLFQSAAPPTRVLSESTAFLMTSMMADVINAGTAWTARREGFTLPAAGKTGTTNDYHDAWFVGFTPKLATGVWVGYDQPKTIIGNGYAGQLAVPMWGRFMSVATRDDEPEWFAQPESVGTATICRLSGKLATDACHSAIEFDEAGQPTERSMVYTEYFVHGTEPVEYCPIHGRSEGVLAASFAGTDSGDTATPAPAPTATTPVVTAVTPAPQEAVEKEEAPKKRRGFWSRLFGRGGDDDDKDKKNENRRSDDRDERDDRGERRGREN